MEVAGLPLHPLVVHAVVVVTPVAVLLAWALAVLPGWRWLTRWVALLTTLMSAGAVLVARASGKALLESRPFLTSPESTVRDLLATHQARANTLTLLVLVLTAVVALAFWLLPAPSGLATGRLGHGGRSEQWVLLVLPAALLVAGAAVIVWVVLTGDAGARAVWGT